MGVKFLDSLDDVTGDVEQKDWRGGADEFLSPTELPPNTGGRLINCVVEDNGRPRTRPGADALGGAALAAARIEALTYFDTPSTEQVFASINATLQSWSGSAWSEIADYPFGANSIAAMAQGHDKLYCSDSSNQWQSWDGSAWSGALGSGVNDPPVGATIMVWHTALNRMFASGAINGQYDALYASVLDPASAGGGKWSNANWCVRIGRGEGERITAVVPGKGFWLAIGKEGSIFMVYADPAANSAADWLIPRLAGSVGCVGKHAMVAVGDSLFVIGPDLALREIVPTGAAVQAGDAPFELLPPASEPAAPYFARINTAAQDKIVLWKYGRYLLAALPLDSATEPSHVLVWNLRLRRLAEVPGATIPAFIGVWTGWTPTAFCTSRFAGVEQLLIGEDDGYVNEWKDREDQDLDDTYTDNDVNVLATIRSRSWDFGTQRNTKDAESVEGQFVSSTAAVDILAVMDDVEQARWSESLQVTQNELPLTLPFDLAVLGPSTKTRNADELIEFREMYVEIEQTGLGKVELKSLAAAAFLNTIDNE